MLEVSTMIIISYDISDDRLRNKFAKYLTKFGHRLQYSVFQIENSERILKNIIHDLDNNFSKKFTQSDSVYIFLLSSSCEIKKYGYARNEDKELIIIK